MSTKSEYEINFAEHATTITVEADKLIIRGSIIELLSEGHRVLLAPADRILYIGKKSVIEHRKSY